MARLRARVTCERDGRTLPRSTAPLPLRGQKPDALRIRCGPYSLQVDINTLAPHPVVYCVLYVQCTPITREQSPSCLTRSMDTCRALADSFSNAPPRPTRPLLDWVRRPVGRRFSFPLPFRLGVYAVLLRVAARGRRRGLYCIVQGHCASCALLFERGRLVPVPRVRPTGHGSPSPPLLHSTLRCAV